MISTFFINMQKAKLKFTLTKADLSILKFYIESPRDITIRNVFQKFTARRKKPHTHFVELLRGCEKASPELFIAYKLHAASITSKGITYADINGWLKDVYGTILDPRTNKRVTDVTYAESKKVIQHLHTMAKRVGRKAVIRYDSLPVENSVESFHHAVLLTQAKASESINLAIDHFKDLSEAEVLALLRFASNSTELASPSEYANFSDRLTRIQEIEEAAVFNAEAIATTELGSKDPTE